MSVEISAIICTYNRLDLLAKAIESLCQQTINPKIYEILIIDNAISNEVSGLVDDFRCDYSDHNIFYIPESKSGAGYARNLAARKARANYLAYIDDDAQADSDWLKLALKVIQTYDNPACVGGPIYPYFTSKKPVWFKEKYEIHRHEENERILKPEEALSGSNMIWRKDILLKIGGFGEDIGPKGEKFTIGEDTIAFNRLRRFNHEARVVYSPTLKVFHFVSANKMCVSNYLKRSFLSGQSSFIRAERFDATWRVIRVFRGLGYIIIYGVRAIWRFRFYPRWENWVIEEGAPIIGKMGLVCSALGIQITMERST